MNNSAYLCARCVEMRFYTEDAEGRREEKCEDC